MRDPCEDSPPASDGFGLIALCFFLSGFAALIYQTAWMRRFGFVFGTSELAVATVLAAYMLGLAAGAAAAGRLAPRLRRPVLSDRVLRSRASAAVGDPVAALETLLDVWSGISRGSPHRAAAQQALELLAVMPPDERTRALHARLTAGIERLLDPERR